MKDDRKSGRGGFTKKRTHADMGGAGSNIGKILRTSFMDGS